MPGNKKQKRILFLNHWARMLGGAELSLIDILQEMVSRADVFLISSEDGPLIERCSEMGVSCRVIPCKGNVDEIRREGLLKTALRQWKEILRFVFYVLRLRQEIGRINPDLIHANVPKSHIALFIIAALGYRKPTIYHIREIFNRGSLPSHIYSILFPRRNATAIAISGAVKDSLPGRVSARSILLYNGIQIYQARIPIEGPPRFLYLGRIVPWKGCHLLIDAFSIVFDKYRSDAGTLSIVGSTLYWKESYRDQLNMQIVSKGLSDVVRMMPHTNRPQDVLVNHDVLCMASDREPFGRAAAEAQGAFLPVIGFHSGGLPEIIENGISGILVENGNIDALAEAMEQFVKNPSLIQQMGKEGNRRVCRLFNRQIQIPLIADSILNN